MPLPPLRRYPDLPGSPPSVTSILKACWPTPALDRWKVNEAARKARDAAVCAFFLSIWAAMWLTPWYAIAAVISYGLMAWAAGQWMHQGEER